jgi:hypothetical protein
VFDGARLLKVLAAHEVSFVVVGGVAATVHGSARVTMDLDLVYARTSDNLKRLVAALAPLKPYLRGAPAGLPFQWDAATLERGLNFTLITEAGNLDLLGEITGGGGYEALVPHATTLDVFGVACPVLGLAKLIAVKRAAGRPKDLEALAELEVIWEEERRGR